MLRQSDKGGVIPAQAGTQLSAFWVPACAGMTAKPKILV